MAAKRVLLGGRQIRGIIFDLDGTLLDTELLSVRAINSVLVSRRAKQAAAPALPAAPAWTVQQHLQIIGMKGEQWTRVVLEQTGMSPDILPPGEFESEWEEALGALLHEATLLPGAGALVARLRAAGARMCIATSSNAGAVAHKRRGHEAVFDAMDGITTGDEVANGKPAPDIFHLAAERLALPAAECLVVEDSPAGVAAAKAAGMRVVAVPHAHMSPAQAQASFVGCTLCLRSLVDWPFDAPEFAWNNSTATKSGCKD